MSPLVRALIAELQGDEGAMRELAIALAPYLPQPSPADEDRWLSTREAAEHLGLSVAAMHRLTAERSVPFEQDGPGAKCWFKRGALDAWRRGEHPMYAPAPLLRSVSGSAQSTP